MSTESEINTRQAWEAGLKVIPLYSQNEEGACECMRSNCEAILKHPRIKAWQKVPHWSEEQLNNRMMFDEYRTGHGVLVDKMLVVDVDARNGGVEALDALNDALGYDISSVCGYVVNSGSGEGSRHLYFYLDNDNLSLMQEHPNFKGIDFKSSGFVVGAGSFHKSGDFYTIAHGDIFNITSAPIELIKLLERPKMNRQKVDGDYVEFSDNELQNIVNHIPNNGSDYQRWISAGMAIYNATNGSVAGLDMWSNWSAKTTPDKHNEQEMPDKWHSFRQGAGTYTIGTLIYYARENGYRPPFKVPKPQQAEEPAINENLDTSHIDIRRPPGIVGRLVDWINSQCLYPAENLAVAAALNCVSNLAGMKHYDAHTRMGLNNIMFCVAGSGTGKDSIINAVTTIYRGVGIIPAQHGGIKSEQEIIRNLLRHQASFYTIDELGIMLEKIVKAKTHGNAAYLEGVIGVIMTAYSRTEGTMPVSGDVKQDIKENIQKEIAALNRRLDKGEPSAELQPLINDLKKGLRDAENGITNPFLSIFGVTTPGTFNDLVTFDMATNGFIARAALWFEQETNPRRKDNYKPEPIDAMLLQSLRALYTGVISSEPARGRVELKGDRIAIETPEDAKEKLDHVYEYFYQLGEEAKNTTGLEAIARRGWELTSKISLALAAETKRRSPEDVLYAFAIAKRDCDYKMKLAHANSTDNESPEERGRALLDVLLQKIPHEKPITTGVLRNGMKSFDLTREDIEAMAQQLEASGLVEISTSDKPRGGHKTLYIKRI